jgi:hypothetical protein
MKATAELMWALVPPRPEDLRVIYKRSSLSPIKKAGWPNGKALDYESRDCRFDPCVGQIVVLLLLFDVLSI